jgi:hypothetical protein
MFEKGMFRINLSLKGKSDKLMKKIAQLGFKYLLRSNKFHCHNQRKDDDMSGACGILEEEDK